MSKKKAIDKIIEDIVLLKPGDYEMPLNGNDSSEHITGSILTPASLGLASKIPEGLCLYDLGFDRYIYVNKNAEKLLGYSCADVINKGRKWLLSILHPEDIYVFNNNIISQEFKDDEPVETEFRVRTSDNSYKWIKCKESVLQRSALGKPEIIICLLEDITDARSAIETARQSEDKFRTLVQYSTDITTVLDVEGKILYESPSILKILGYEQNEIVGENAFSFVHREDLQRVLKAFKMGLLTYGKPITVDYRFRKKDGSYAYLESTGTNYTHLSYLNGIVINSRDITHRKLSDEKIQRLTAAVEQSSNTVMITDINGKIEYVNNKFVSLTGYEKDEVIGQTPAILKSGYTGREEYTKMWEEILTGKTWVGEFKNKKKNGECYWESAKISPVVDNNDRITNFIAIKDDITERKMQEEMLRKSLEEKEIMLKEIHHRVKNNLQIVNSLLNLQANAVEDTGLKTQLLISQNRVKSMALIHQLLYKSGDLRFINMEEYLYGLSSFIMAAYNDIKDRISIKIECQNINFSIETAVPFGLLVNELVTNTMKHGSAGNREGIVLIRLLKNDDGSYCLLYDDNKIGTPLNIVNGHVVTAGMYLIDTLINQIEGTIDASADGGSCYKINFRGSNYQNKFYFS